MLTEKRKFGDFGESVACKFLMKHGFYILEKNYLRQWGEIDIVAKKREVIHFFEVKTVKQEVKFSNTNDDWRAEENIHPWKLKRLEKAIQTYLLEKNFESEWQLDALIVEVNLNNKKVTVKYLPNIVL
jgi:putative endonuclease